MQLCLVSKNEESQASNLTLHCTVKPIDLFNVHDTLFQKNYHCLLKTNYQYHFFSTTGNLFNFYFY